ncbi:hypothetical protein DXB23_09140 [Dorea sp. OM02-2LB]|nr:hypothetical protein DXB23_09140 [Dorea sp. OM02-2LB]RGV96949.1 hypothetical protein DWV97_06215 [Ruminococcus sp. AF14-10]
MSNSSLPICPLREEKSFSQRAFSIYTDIRKLQDKAKTSYTLNTRRLRFVSRNICHYSLLWRSAIILIGTHLQSSGTGQLTSLSLQ